MLVISTLARRISVSQVSSLLNGSALSAEPVKNVPSTLYISSIFELIGSGSETVKAKPIFSP